MGYIALLQGGIPEVNLHQSRLENTSGSSMRTPWGLNGGHFTDWLRIVRGTEELKILSISKCVRGKGAQHPPQPSWGVMRNLGIADRRLTSYHANEYASCLLVLVIIANSVAAERELRHSSHFGK